MASITDFKINGLSAESVKLNNITIFTKSPLEGDYDLVRTDNNLLYYRIPYKIAYNLYITSSLIIGAGTTGQACIYSAGATGETNKWQIWDNRAIMAFTTRNTNIPIPRNRRNGTTTVNGGIYTDAGAQQTNQFTSSSFANLPNNFVFAARDTDGTATGRDPTNSLPSGSVWRNLVLANDGQFVDRIRTYRVTRDGNLKCRITGEVIPLQGNGNFEITTF